MKHSRDVVMVAIIKNILEELPFSWLLLSDPQEFETDVDILIREDFSLTATVRRLELNGLTVLATYSRIGGHIVLTFGFGYFLKFDFQLNPFARTRRSNVLIGYIWGEGPFQNISLEERLCAYRTMKRRGKMTMTINDPLQIRALSARTNTSWSISPDWRERTCWQFLRCVTILKRICESSSLKVIHVKNHPTPHKTIQLLVDCPHTNKLNAWNPKWLIGRAKSEITVVIWP